MGRFSATSRQKGNRIIRSYGAGDGNRTHVRSLGSFYTAIVRRPLGRKPEDIIGLVTRARASLELAAVSYYENVRQNRFGLRWICGGSAMLDEGVWAEIKVAGEH